MSYSYLDEYYASLEGNRLHQHNAIVNGMMMHFVGDALALAITSYENKVYGYEEFVEKVREIKKDWRFFRPSDL